MYSIFIKNFRTNDGEIQTDEQLLYSIPISDSESMNALTDPVVSTGLGKAGSFEFSLDVIHPYYNSFLQMRTIMRVEYEGDTIFRGRVLTIDVSPMTGAKKVHLEGDLAFLMDSQIKGTKEADRKKTAVISYLRKIISAHNNQMVDEGKTDEMFAIGVDKIFKIGEVPGQYSDSIQTAQRVVVKDDKFGDDSFENASDALSNLTSEFGGYFRTRYADGDCYLDWLENSYRYEVNEQPIEIGENMIDISGSTEVDNIFTALIPVGSKNGEDIFIKGYKTEVHGDNDRILVPQIVSQFSNAELNKGFHSKSDYENAVKDYGIIYKTEKFDAETQEELWNKATKWIRDTYVGGVTSFSLSALDLHHVYPSYNTLLTGDRVKIIYPDLAHHTDGYTPKIEKTLTIISVTHNLYHPEQNQYSIGVSDTIFDRSGSRSNAAKKTANRSGGKASAAVPKKQKAGDDGNKKRDVEREKLEREAIHFIVSEEHNNPLYQRVMQEDPSGTRGAGILKSSQIRLTDDLYNYDQQDTLDEQVTAYMATSILLKGQGALIDFGLPYVSSFINPETQQKVSDYRVGVSMELNGYRNAVQQNRLNMDNVEMKDGHWVLKEGVNPEDLTAGVTTSFNGNTGDMNGMGLNVGLDGTGELPTVSANGRAGSFNLLDPSTWFKPNGDVVDEDPDPTIDMQGGNGGSAGIGSGGDLNGWQVTLNRNVSYTWTDDENHVHRVNLPKGTVGVNDLHFTKKYDSLRINLGYVDVLLADYAHITSLEALKATIDEIDATYITADYIDGDLITGILADVDAISVNSLSCSGSMGCSDALSCQSLYINGMEVYTRWVKLSPSDSKTLIVHQTDGTSFTFKKGDTEAAYIAGWNACVDAAVSAGAVYTRTANYNDKVVGGNYYAHYYDYQGTKVNIGTGWYLTSYAPRDKNPTVPNEWKS